MQSKKELVCFYLFLIISILINVFIVVEGFIGGSDSASQSFSLTNLFIEFVKLIDPNSPLVTNPEITHSIIRKLVGHFLLFGLSGLFTTLTMIFINDSMTIHKKEIIIVSSFCGLSLAFISELAQLFTPGRYMSIIDMLIDLSGYISFGGITFLIAYLSYRKKHQKKA